MSATKEVLPIEEQMSQLGAPISVATPYDWRAEQDFDPTHTIEAINGTPLEATVPAQVEPEIKSDSQEPSKFANVLQAIRTLPEQLDRKTRRLATVAATIGLLLVAAPVASAEGKTHKVKTGDDMTKIAEKNHIKLSTLIKRNPQVENPNLIFPGQKVFIRKDRAVKPGTKKPAPASKTTITAPAAESAPAAATTAKISPVFEASELIGGALADKAPEAKSTPVPVKPSEAIRLAQDKLFLELENAAQVAPQPLNETPELKTEAKPKAEADTIEPLSISKPALNLETAIDKVKAAIEAEKAEAAAREAEKAAEKAGVIKGFDAKTRESAGITWSWPVSKDLGVNSCWHEPRPGHLHAGYDIAGPMGTPVRAAAKGVVVFALNDTQPIQGYGNGVFIRHTGENGAVRYSLSAHLSSFAEGIKAGTKVKRGQIIGAMGDTASPGAVHLHFNMQSDPDAAGATENPATYLPDDGRAGFDGCK